MTQRRFDELAGTRLQPVEGTTGCFLVGNDKFNGYTMFVIKQAEIVKGSKIFAKVTGSDIVKMEYNVEEDYFILKNN